MGLIDWIKNRGRQHPVEPEFDPRAQGHKNWNGVFAELREDYALAKQRNETGREPESRNADQNKDAPFVEPPLPVDVVWESGNAKRQEKNPEGNNDFTIHAKGVIGESAEGFHQRVDVMFVKGEFDRTDYMRGDWSHAVPTQDAAMREMKAAMVTHDRRAAEWTGQHKGAGTQSISVVNKAVKEGRPVDLGGEVRGNRKANERRGPSIER